MQIREWGMSTKLRLSVILDSIKLYILFEVILIINVECSGPNLVNNWPDPRISFGQIGGVSIDTHGNVFVFHRGDRVWDSNSFDEKNLYRLQPEGPILKETIVVLDPFTGSVLFAWGSAMFYLPHGLTIDHQNNVWVTDVARHQVFKYPPLNISSAAHRIINPILKFGTEFRPGNDNSHFCKPTSVAVLTTGDFFIADGYCNSRIIKYNKEGKIVLQWGRSTPQGHIVHPSPYSFSIPHGLALAEDKESLFVADRENGRIAVFNYTNGRYLWEIRSPQYLGETVYSVAYTPIEGGLLYAVNGPSFTIRTPIQGVIFSLETRTAISVFFPPGYFHRPHDVAVSPNGHLSYVVELDPKRIWQFHYGDMEKEKADSKTSEIFKNSTKKDEPLEKTKGDQLTIPAPVYKKPPDSDSVLTGTTGAILLVSFIVLGTFVLFAYLACTRKGKYRRYETRGLMSDDDENGMQLM